MNIMKVIKNIFLISSFTCLAGIGISSCNLGGLQLQKSEIFHPHVLDPHQHMTAWRFLVEHTDTSLVDTGMVWMMRAIQYAGIDSTEYLDTGRTFIFLNNSAVLNISRGKVTTNCYFGKYTVVEKDSKGDTVFKNHKPVMVPATNWSDYPKQQVKDYLEYLIIKGEYSFNNLTATNITVNTLLPPNTDTLNPQSIMTMLETNDGNSEIQLNNFYGSAGYVSVQTGGILCTNGVVHAIGNVLFYQKQ